MRILTFDPSGNHKEGHGVTGFAMFEDDRLLDFGRIESEKFKTTEAYWNTHLDTILTFAPELVVYETYKLQPKKAMQQSWSELETPQLIGAIRLYCFNKQIATYGQDPSIKTRFSDATLEDLGYATAKYGKRYNTMYMLDRQCVDHERDAVRHGLYFWKYNRKKVIV